jgi:hypothetical protein
MTAAELEQLLDLAYEVSWEPDEPDDEAPVDEVGDE